MTWLKLNLECLGTIFFFLLVVGYIGRLAIIVITWTLRKLRTNIFYIKWATVYLVNRVILEIGLFGYCGYIVLRYYFAKN
jgi:hypothetical protein